MLIWKGAGILTVIIPAVLAIIALLITRLITGSDELCSQPWFMGLLSVVSGALIIMTGLRLNKDKTEIDSETGQEITVKKNKHTMFFIQMQYWGIVWVIMGFVYVFIVK